MRQVLGVLVVLGMIEGRAAAQSASNPARAEQRLRHARDLAKANRWAQACPELEASLRDDPALDTRLTLASCYEHLGKLASAWGLYREAIGLAKKAGDPTRADLARSQAAALEPRLPKLAIAAPVPPPSGLIVKRDATVVSATELGIALYADPGPHVVTASAPGLATVTLNVTLVEGKTETVALPALTAQPAEPIPEATPITVEAPPQPAPATPARTYVALGLGAAGVVALGVGFVFGAKARSSFNDAKALCGDDLHCTPDRYAEDKRLVDDAHASATISTVLVIGGAATVAAGAILYLTAPRPHEHATARLVPVTHAGGAGLALTGMF